MRVPERKNALFRASRWNTPKAKLLWRSRLRFSQQESHLFFILKSMTVGRAILIIVPNAATLLLAPEEASGAARGNDRWKKSCQIC
jgi:hypothetical protein